MAYGYKDLVVRNNTRVSVRLRMEIDTKQPVVHTALYGAQPIPFEVTVETNIMKELLPASNGGKSGWEVETIRKTSGSQLYPKNLQESIDYRVVDIYQPNYL